MKIIKLYILFFNLVLFGLSQVSEAKPVVITVSPKTVIGAFILFDNAPEVMSRTLLSLNKNLTVLSLTTDSIEELYDVIEIESQVGSLSKENVVVGVVISGLGRDDQIRLSDEHRYSGRTLAFELSQILKNLNVSSRLVIHFNASYLGRPIKDNSNFLEVFAAAFRSYGNALWAADELILTGHIDSTDESGSLPVLDSERQTVETRLQKISKAFQNGGSLPHLYLAAYEINLNIQTFCGLVISSLIELATNSKSWNDVKNRFQEIAYFKKLLNLENLFAKNILVSNDPPEKDMSPKAARRLTVTPEGLSEEFAPAYDLLNKSLSCNSKF
jgi:hypothetical protein